MTATPGALPLPPVDRPVVFAGGDVLRDHAVEALRRFADRCNVGVTNSWDAKGVLRWDDPHHFGTLGLQRDDFVLAGFDTAPCIVAVGVDDAVVARDRWALSPVVHMAPRLLETASETWPRWGGDLQPPAFLTEMSSLVQPMYQSIGHPLVPPRAIADISSVLGPDDRVQAMPGLAGFWVARAFPTTRPGLVHVARERGEPAAAGVRVVVTDGNPDDVSGEVIVEVWGDGDGRLRTPEDHRLVLTAALARGGRQLIEVPIDFAVTTLLVDLAGPVTAWQVGR